MKPKPPSYITSPVAPDKYLRISLKRPIFEPDNGATAWYTEDIGLGSPVQQKIKLMIDTGTKNTWVTSTQCTTAACAPHAKFNADQSSTYKPQGEKINIDFGAWGSMSVTPSVDLITLPGVDPLSVMFDLSVNYDGAQFEALIADGGIGIPAHIPTQSPTSTLLLNLLKDKGFIGYNIVSFGYNRASRLGEVVFGGINFDTIKSETINIINMIDFPSDKECWLVNLDSMDGIFSDGSSQNMLTNVAFALDTGSSQFKGDADFINACKAVITKQGTLPEKIISPATIFDYDYPTLTLTINGVVYRLPPEKYFIQVAENEWHLAFHFLADCENEFLVGTTFLETVYTTFDFDNKYIVLAEPKV